MFKKIAILSLLLAPTLCAAGSATYGNYYYAWFDWTLNANNYASMDYSCPGAYPRVISGSCGHRDANSAQQDIKVNYSGPAPGAETTAWRCLVSNSNLFSSRATRWTVVCGK